MKFYLILISIIACFLFTIFSPIDALLLLFEFILAFIFALSIPIIIGYFCFYSLDDKVQNLLKEEDYNEH